MNHIKTFENYQKINIQNFLYYTSNDDPNYDVIGYFNLGINVNMNINRSETFLDKIIRFNSREINRIKEHNLRNYEIKVEDKFIGILDLDNSRSTINNSIPLFKGKKVSGRNFGNTDYIWIYKLEDEWYLIVISRSNIIPFHKNPYVMANRNSFFEYYKCDQFDEVLSFIEDKLA